MINIVIIVYICVFYWFSVKFTLIFYNTPVVGILIKKFR